MAVLKLTEEEYESFEETIASSAKGRAFLRDHARRHRVMSAEEVKRVVYQIRDDIENRAGGAGQGRVEMLRAELQEMASSIVETKRQIAALQPTDTGKNRIMAATGELDAIVSATERATSEIIAQAELLIGMADDIRALKENALAARVEGAATEILMACSFQDITGQRTNKVVNAMRYLEHRINAMVLIWGSESFAHDGDPVEDETQDRRPDAHLLNGPATDGTGVDQADIDALFDTPGEAAAPPPPPPPAKEPAPRKAAKAAPAPAAPPPSAGASMGQDDIDSLFN